jgi:hypothetical protein
MLTRDRNIPSPDYCEGSIDRENGWPLPEGANREYRKGWYDKNKKLGQIRLAKVSVTLL